MKITIDTTSMESLNEALLLVDEAIKNIEKDSKVAREKRKEKTKQVQKSDKISKDILISKVEEYEALLSLRQCINKSKSAIKNQQKMTNQDIEEADIQEAIEDKSVEEPVVITPVEDVSIVEEVTPEVSEVPLVDSMENTSKAILEDYSEQPLILTNGALEQETIKVDESSIDSFEEPVEQPINSSELSSSFATIIQARIDELNKEEVQKALLEEKKNAEMEATTIKEESIEKTNESQNEIAKVPKMATPTVSWDEMNKLIDALKLKREMDDKNLSRDEIYALYYLRSNPEAAPSSDFIKDLLIWSGIAPLEAVTPRTTGPAPVQEEPVKMDSEEIPTPEFALQVDVNISNEDAEVHEGKPDLSFDPSEELGDDAFVFEHSDEVLPENNIIQDEASESTKNKFVLSREPFNIRFNKNYLILKSLINGENLENKPQSYVDIILAIFRLKNTYNTNTPEVNENTVNDINALIKNAKDLTEEQCRHLYNILKNCYKQIINISLANSSRDKELVPNAFEENYVELSDLLNSQR